MAAQIREKKQVMSLQLSSFFNINSKKLLRMRNKCSKWDLGIEYNCIMSVFFVKTHFSLDFLQQKILFTNSGENPMWFYFGSSKNFACQNMYITYTLLTSYLIPFGWVNNYLSDEGSSTCPFCPLQYYCPAHRVLIRVSLWAGIWDHRSQRQEENLQEAISY